MPDLNNFQKTTRNFKIRKIFDKSFRKSKMKFEIFTVFAVLSLSCVAINAIKLEPNGIETPELRSVYPRSISADNVNDSSNLKEKNSLTPEQNRLLYDRIKIIDDRYRLIEKELQKEKHDKFNQNAKISKLERDLLQLTTQVKTQAFEVDKYKQTSKNLESRLGMADQERNRLIKIIAGMSSGSGNHPTIELGAILNKRSDVETENLRKTVQEVQNTVSKQGKLLTRNQKAVKYLYKGHQSHLAAMKQLNEYKSSVTNVTTSVKTFQSVLSSQQTELDNLNRRVDSNSANLVSVQSSYAMRNSQPSVSSSDMANLKDEIQEGYIRYYRSNFYDKVSGLENSVNQHKYQIPELRV